MKGLIAVIVLLASLFSGPVYLANPIPPGTNLIGRSWIVGTNGSEWKISGQAGVMIDYAHNKVHEGKTWQADAEFMSIANAGVAAVVWLTPTNKYNHTEMMITAGGAGWVRLYESPVVTNFTIGTELVCIDHNRMYLTATNCETKIRSGLIVTNNGNRLTGFFLPGGSTATTRVGGVVREGSEFVLKTNTYYMLQFSNTSGSAVSASLLIEWYEEDNYR